jgi:diguanylate cyclase (GGDEF)-like protein/PAS domain S-box-containing protein
MIVLRNMGVRSRMIALISAAILPFAGLIGAGIAYSYGEADRDARATVTYDAQLGAAKFSRVFLDAKVVLGTLRGMPPLQIQDRSRCDGFMQKVLASQPMFVTMGLIDAAGNIVCHNKPSATGLFGDHDLAVRMLKAHADDLVVGRFMVGPVSKKPTVAVAMRLPNTASGQELSVFGSLNLDVFQEVARAIAGNTNHTVALIDTASERVLVRWPNIAAFGTPFPNHPLIRGVALHPEGGTTFSVGFDDVPRFFGFAPVSDATGSSLALARGFPEQEAFSEVKSRSLWALIFSLSAFLVAIALATTIAYWTQLRPIRRLAQMSERIGDGDFSTPVSMERWQAMEFRGLATSLNKSADKLSLAHEAEQKTIESERRFRLLADNTADMITTVDNSGKRTFVSGASREMLGYEPHELVGQDPKNLVLKEDQRVVASFLEKIRKSAKGASEQYRVRHRDGTILWVEVNGRRMTDDSGYVFTMRNIAKRKTVEAQLEAANDQLSRLATTDELTGLNNRREFNRLVERESRQSYRDGSDLSMLFIDVDRFKAFNDVYGHPEGDRCLKEVAAAISKCLRRPGDLSARYGGEEFAVILPNTSADGAAARGEVIRQAVAALNLQHSAGEKGYVTISVGVATTTRRSQLPGAELLKRADEALYTAKAEGRDCVAQYQPQAASVSMADDRQHR